MIYYSIDEKKKNNQANPNEINVHVYKYNAVHFELNKYISIKKN